MAKVKFDDGREVTGSIVSFEGAFLLLVVVFIAGIVRGLNLMVSFLAWMIKDMMAG